MGAGSVANRRRSEQIDYVSAELLPRTALLTRLLFRDLGGELSRTELGLLRTLSDGPRRITELAELEGLAQPTMTMLIKQLEQRRHVQRERRSEDGRVVLVDLTESGRAALEGYQEQIRAAIGATSPSSRPSRSTPSSLRPKHSRNSSPFLQQRPIG